MPAWCCHTTMRFLVTQRPPNANGDHPTMRVGFRFCQFDGQMRPSEELWGLLDSGASITAVPAHSIVLVGNRYPSDLAGPIPVTLTGVRGRCNVPAYPAVLSVSGRLLHGAFCPNCGVKLIERRCPDCLATPPSGAFLIAAVEDLPFPIIGRDVVANFLTVLNPLARDCNEKFTILASGRLGRTLAKCLMLVRGASLSP